MLELTRRRERQDAGSGGGPFDEDAAAPGQVNVVSGPYSQALPVGNMAVGEVRRRFGDRLDIEQGSMAIVDGEEVADDYVVRDGQVLLFAKRAGEKG